MPVPEFSADDYAAAMSRLLPRGPVWPRDADSDLMALMGALAPSYARASLDAKDLIADIFPATTSDLLPEWEATLGLPDPCTPLNPSTEQRVAAVAAKFIGLGGQTPAYFIAVAAYLGFTITVTEHTYSRFGHPFGETFGGIDWAYTWDVNAALHTVVPFYFSEGRFGDPFATFGNAEMECRLTAIKPAHTILRFIYT